MFTPQDTCLNKRRLRSLEYLIVSRVFPKPFQVVVVVGGMCLFRPDYCPTREPLRWLLYPNKKSACNSFGCWMPRIRRHPQLILTDYPIFPITSKLLFEYFVNRCYTTVNMLYLEEGIYYSLKDISDMLGITRQGILNRANKLGIKPISFGRLFKRYHQNDVLKIKQSYEKIHS